MNQKTKAIPILLITFYLLLFTASIASAADTAPPSVVSVYPSNNAGSVSLQPLISVIFSEDINPGTVNKDTFQLLNENSDPLKIVPITRISGEVSYSLTQKMAVFKLSGDLVNNIKYTAKVTTGIKDFSGNALAQEYVWKFTTVSGGGLSDPNQNQGSPNVINVGTNDAEDAESELEPEQPSVPSVGISISSAEDAGSELEPKQPSVPSVGISISSKGFLGGIVPCGCMEREAGTNKCTREVPCNICHLFVGVSNIIDFLLKNIAFPLGAVAILYGGFMMMTSGGSEEKVKKGKTALQYAVLGIIIAFAGWLIVDTILTSLVTGKLDLKAFWNKFPGCK